MTDNLHVDTISETVQTKSKTRKGIQVNVDHDIHLKRFNPPAIVPTRNRETDMQDLEADVANASARLDQAKERENEAIKTLRMFRDWQNGLALPDKYSWLKKESEESLDDVSTLMCLIK